MSAYIKKKSAGKIQENRVILFLLIILDDLKKNGYYMNPILLKYMINRILHGKIRIA